MGKYRFNREQLKFIEDKKGFYGILLKVLKYLFLSILLALLYYLIFAIFFDTSEEKRLMRENRLLMDEYNKASDKVEILEGVITDLKNRDKNIYTQIFRSSPPSLFTGDSDNTIYKKTDSLDNVELVKFSQEKSDTLLDMVQDQNIKFRTILNILKESDGAISIPNILPIRGFVISQTGAGLGQKIHPFYKTTYLHQGLDMLASIGTKVVATSGGKVVKVVTVNKGMGISVRIEHANGYKTVYGHLNSVSVKEGQTVKQGAIIGEVGNSGLSFAPHLHYEVLLNDEPVNPVNYFFADLSPELYREMSIISINNGQSLD